jgi:pimeloyl-ACP methyl ester carboxylesterase
LSTTASPTLSATGSPAFGSVRQIDAGLLNIGYVDLGPADGPAVLLLHGWPYDIHSYVEVAPALAAAGYRALVPYLRGYGSTRFRSDTTMRNGEQAALAVDAIAFMDALYRWRS